MDGANVRASPFKEKMEEKRVKKGEELNEVDMKILRALTFDARLSSRQLAKQCGISTSTALSRVKRLEEEGIIKGYSALLDHERLGYTLTVVTEITVSKGRLLEVESEIAKLPNVCCVYDVTGLIDAIVIAKFKNREELSKFAKRLLAMPYVERTNTHVVLTTVKEDFRLV
ncbi:MAG: Lrp/AsnC family transcriptional regulator [Candidatus Bathyarchaeia archaeon]